MTSLIQREITPFILKYLTGDFKQRIIVIYGARQVGKTTLSKCLMKQFSGKSEYYSCDYADVRTLFSYENAHNLGKVVKGLDLLVIDEAQRVENIGLVLKILADNFPQLKVIATGSSSFELSNNIKEPLTGRKVEFQLNPLSFSEVYKNISYLEQKRQIEDCLRFGFYPDIVLSHYNQKQKQLIDLAESYLFKDVFTFQTLKKPELLTKLLRLLAFQIGNQVSFQELALKTGVDQTVIQRYIHLLEESFVIYRVGAFSNNLRKEISKSRKIYFYDLGIRNAVINNFNPLELRNDVGMLWENFLMTERLKKLHNQQKFRNRFFWRNYSKNEIDYIEEYAGKISAFEFKFNENKRKTAKEVFLASYPTAAFTIVNQSNFQDFVL